MLHFLHRAMFPSPYSAWFESSHLGVQCYRRLWLALADLATTEVCMARGWESKSVESQIESAQSQPEGRREMSPQVATASRKKETLLLARTHLQKRLECCSHPRYQAMLETALADLERQLTDLAPRASGASR